MVISHTQPQVIYKVSNNLGAKLKIPGARKVTWSNFLIEDPQTLDANIKKCSRLGYLAQICAPLHTIFGRRQ